MLDVPAVIFVTPARVTLVNPDTMFVAAKSTRKPLALLTPTLVVTAPLYPTITLEKLIELVESDPDEWS